MTKELLKKLFGILLIIYCVVIIINILTNKSIYQWDLDKYYWSAKAYASGMDPYDPVAVSSMAKKHVILFTYPPIVLLVWQPLVKIDFNSLFYFYLILKCISLVGLVYLWRNAFLDKRVDIPFYLLCLLGFNSAIYLDLRAGNMIIFEQCLIWLAFFYYLRRNLPAFCILIITASIFKIQPILFLFLLLFAENKDRYKFLIGSFMVFGIIFLLQYLSNPALFSDFMATVVISRGFEHKIINPGTFTFMRDLIRTFLRIRDPIPHTMVSLLFYLLIVTPVIFISGLAYRRIKSAGIEDKEKWLVFFTCLTYALICVSFKGYSYILLIVPAYFIIKRATNVKAYGLLIFFVSISAVGVTLPGARLVFNFFWGYYPLFTAYLLWGLYLYEIFLFKKFIKP